VDALSAMKKRVAVREFLPKQISDEDITTIVDAGLNAATSMNRQSWFFTVVQHSETLKAISGAVGYKLIESEIPSLVERAQSSGFSSFHHAPTVIFISSDHSRYSLADCANAAQNMCNAATALNIGSCYISSFVQALDHPSLRSVIEKFDLPEGYRPTFAVALGYPAHQPQKKERKWKVSYIKE
jgi:nitroreductase